MLQTKPVPAKKKPPATVRSEAAATEVATGAVTVRSEVAATEAVTEADAEMTEADATEATAAGNSVLMISCYKKLYSLKEYGFFIDSAPGFTV